MSKFKVGDILRYTYRMEPFVLRYSGALAKVVEVDDLGNPRIKWMATGETPVGHWLRQNFKLAEDRKPAAYVFRTLTGNLVPFSGVDRMCKGEDAYEYIGTMKEVEVEETGEQILEVGTEWSALGGGRSYYKVVWLSEHAVVSVMHFPDKPPLTRPTIFTRKQVLEYIKPTTTKVKKLQLVKE